MKVWQTLFSAACERLLRRLRFLNAPLTEDRIGCGVASFSNPHSLIHVCQSLIYRLYHM